MAKSSRHGADFVIHVDVFNIQVAVFRTEKQRRRTMKAMGMSPDPMPLAPHATAHCDVDDEGQAWFCMVIKPEATQATWAHECVHIADFIMDHVGVPIDLENTEVRAYLVGHLFQGLQDGLTPAEG